jgi:hypothetical protein
MGHEREQVRERKHYFVANRLPAPGLVDFPASQSFDAGEGQQRPDRGSGICGEAERREREREERGEAERRESPHWRASSERKSSNWTMQCGHLSATAAISSSVNASCSAPFNRRMRCPRYSGSFTCHPFTHISSSRRSPDE